MDASRCWLDAAAHWLSILHDLQRLTPLFTSRPAFCCAASGKKKKKKLPLILFLARVTNLTAFCLFAENKWNFRGKQRWSVARLCWFPLIRPNLTRCISSSSAWVYAFEVPVVAMSDTRRLISIDYEGRCERAPNKPCCLGGGRTTRAFTLLPYSKSSVKLRTDCPKRKSLCFPFLFKLIGCLLNNSQEAAL